MKTTTTFALLIRLLPRLMSYVAVALVCMAGVEHVKAGTLTDGLIGYWQFDGNGHDNSGGGRDLELVGGVGFNH